MILSFLSLGSKNFQIKNENEATKVKDNAPVLEQNLPKMALVTLTYGDPKYLFEKI